MIVVRYIECVNERLTFKSKMYTLIFYIKKIMSHSFIDCFMILFFVNIKKIMNRQNFDIARYYTYVLI